MTPTALSSYSQKSLKKNAVLNIIKTAMGLIFPLISFPYVSRVLAPEGIGRVNYVRSLVQYFALFAALGINAYGMREAAKIRNDKNTFSLFVKEMFAINMISTLVSYLIFFAVIFLVPAFSDYVPLLLVSSASILFTTLGVEWAYSALEEYAYITLRSFLFQLLSLVLLFVFVRRHSDVLQYAAIGVVSSGGANLLNFMHLRKFVSWRTVGSLHFKKHLKPIFILFSTAVAISLYTILDTTMLGFFCGDEETGYYTAATRINSIIIGMITAVGVVLRPRLSNYAETNAGSFDSLLRLSCDCFLMLTIPAAAGLCFLSEPVMLLICGEQFREAIPVMRLVTPVIFFITFGQFFTDQIFMPLRKDWYSFYPVLIAGVLNVGMNFLFIPRYGATGAAVATLVAESVVCTTKFFLCRRTYRETCSLFKRIWQYIVASLFMCVFLFVFSRVLPAREIAVLFLSVVGGIVVYALFLLLVRNECAIRMLGFVKNRFFRRSA